MLQITIALILKAYCYLEDYSSITGKGCHSFQFTHFQFWKMRGEKIPTCINCSYIYLSVMMKLKVIEFSHSPTFRHWTDSARYVQPSCCTLCHLAMPLMWSTFWIRMEPFTRWFCMQLSNIKKLKEPTCVNQSLGIFSFMPQMFHW